MIRVLLDEAIDVRLRLHFGQEFRVETVMYRGWRGTKNGELLRLAAAEYDVLMTLDRSLPHQQDISGLDQGVVVLRAQSPKLDALIRLLPEAARVATTIEPGTYREVTHAADQ